MRVRILAILAAAATLAGAAHAQEDTMCFVQGQGPNHRPCQDPGLTCPPLEESDYYPGMWSCYPGEETQATSTTSTEQVEISTAMKGYNLMPPSDAECYYSWGCGFTYDATTGKVTGCGKTGNYSTTYVSFVGFDAATQSCDCTAYHNVDPDDYPEPEPNVEGYPPPPADEGEEDYPDDSYDESYGSSILEGGV